MPSPAQTATEQQVPDSVGEASPAPAPAPVLAAPAAPASADDLSKIKGLGPKLQTVLPTLGLSTYAQIAALSDADLAALDPKLGPFAGRPTRDVKIFACSRTGMIILETGFDSVGDQDERHASASRGFG